MDIKEFFGEYGEVAVAFSGGVDSAVLLMLAKKYAKRVKAYFVKSQFQPHFELEDALEISKLLGVELKVITLDVLGDKTVADNPDNRCYYCKKKVFGEIKKAAKQDGFDIIVDGTNATDDVSDRPGFKALGEMRVLSPLRLCGYTKADIRKAAAESELHVSDKPSYACLATRIPHGTAITEQLLKKTEEAENELRQAGFVNFRVRYLNGAAKLELGKSDFDLFYKNKDRVYSILSSRYDGVLLDLKERSDE